MSANPEIDGSDNATGLSGAGAKNGGRVQSAVNYSTSEHEILLDIVAGIKAAFESSVASPVWKNVHDEYVQKSPGGRTKEVLHTHFAEMKSAIGSSISALSAQVPSILVPTVETELPAFYAHVLTEVSKGSAINKAYQSKRWWNLNVVSKLAGVSSF
jgi:hypothetical protein